MKKITLVVQFFITLACFSQQTVSEPLTVYENDTVKVRSYNFAATKPMLHRQNDTVYVVNFWATWCAPCIKELPFFERINSEYKDKKVKVILVSLDMKKQIPSSLLPFIRKNKLQSEVIHLYDPDANSWIGNVDRTWSGALPATLIYSRDNRKFYEQSFTFEELEKEVIQFIK